MSERNNITHLSDRIVKTSADNAERTNREPRAIADLGAVIAAKARLERFFREPASTISRRVSELSPDGKPQTRADFVAIHDSTPLIDIRHHDAQLRLLAEPASSLLEQAGHIGKALWPTEEYRRAWRQDAAVIRQYLDHVDHPTHDERRETMLRNILFDLSIKQLFDRAAATAPTDRPADRIMRPRQVLPGTGAMLFDIFTPESGADKPYTFWAFRTVHPSNSRFSPHPAASHLGVPVTHDFFGSHPDAPITVADRLADELDTGIRPDPILDAITDKLMTYIDANTSPYGHLRPIE